VLVQPQKGDAGWDEYWAKDDSPRRRASWDIGRNYNTFAILADVRNGFGFAGVDTGDGFKPILTLHDDGVDNPHRRGWPKDVCQELAHEDVDHSPNWLTLRELNEYDWQQVTKSRGVVTLDQYQKWVKEGREGRPDRWCGGISGPNIEVLSMEEADERLASGLLPGLKETHVRIEWRVTYAEASGFYKHHLPSLNEVAKREGVSPDDLRLVFYFDS